MRRLTRTGIALFLAIVLLQILANPCLAQGSLTHWLQTDVTIKNTGTDACSYVRVEAPLVMSSMLYGILVTEEFSVAPEEIIQNERGERVGVFNLGSLAPGAEVVFTQRFKIVSDSGDAGMPGFEHIENPKVLLGNREIEMAASGAVLGLFSDRERAGALAAFTHRHIRYDKDSPWRNRGALTAFQYREGVCEDFAALFVALAKAIGLDSRMVYGYLQAKEGEPFQRHAWAEVFLGEEGWVPVDPTVHGRLGLMDPPAIYIGQWYQDQPIRLRYAGGRLSASRADTVALSEEPAQ